MFSAISFFYISFSKQKISEKGLFFKRCFWLKYDHGILIRLLKKIISNKLDCHTSVEFQKHFQTAKYFTLKRNVYFYITPDNQLVFEGALLTIHSTYNPNFPHC